MRRYRLPTRTEILDAIDTGRDSADYDDALADVCRDYVRAYIGKDAAGVDLAKAHIAALATWAPRKAAAAPDTQPDSGRKGLTHRLRSRFATGSDGGFTLIEVAVAIVVFAVLGTIVASTLFAANRFTTATDTSIRDEAQVLDAVTRIGQRDVPLARSILVAEPNRLTLVVGYSADYDDGCRIVTYRIDAGALVSDVSGCADVAIATTRVVVDRLTGTNPIFTYYSADNAVLATPARGGSIARVGVAVTSGTRTLTTSAVPRVEAPPTLVTG